MFNYTGFLRQHNCRVKLEVLKRLVVVIRMPANLSVRVLAREGRPRRERVMVLPLAKTG